MPGTDARPGPERPPERGPGPERPPERGPGPERPPERGPGPERPPERGPGPERPPERRPGPTGTRFTDVRTYAEVGSTNRVAAELARSGVPEGLVVVADHQTAGRGRRGRSWEAPPGSSLLVSVVLQPPHRITGAPLPTVACALAAADACEDVAGFVPGLKWPNDLVVGERKLAGVLAEAVTGCRAVVVGLGLNVRWPGPMPAHLEAVAVTAEGVAGGPVDRGALLDSYLVRLEDRSRAMTAMIDDYRRRCVTLGQTVRVELPGGRSCTGLASDVDCHGSLLVVAGDVILRVTAGDVVHLRHS